MRRSPLRVAVTPLPTAYYLAYTLYLVLAASHHDTLAGFSTVMLVFVLPLTVAGLAFTAWNQFRGTGRFVR